MFGLCTSGSFFIFRYYRREYWLWDEGATAEDVEWAASQAQVLDNILDFDKKFKTILGEKGITYLEVKNNAQYARALIKKPKILILDDSLSAVDTKTEDAILRSLRNDESNVTVIMISHRISTIKDADYIYYIEEGKVKEAGTHEELLYKKEVTSRCTTNN